MPRAFDAALGEKGSGEDPAAVATDDPYLAEPSIRTLTRFFAAKPVAALKEEDAREQWYQDWVAYQAEHRLYASVLSPSRFSTLGCSFDVLRYARFLEVFAYFSPAHAYSAQVTFLGLFGILMGSNEALKREAVGALERGGLLAFAVSEQAHGADLLANEFRVTEKAPGKLVANGSKYYIGNANAAVMIAILAKRDAPNAEARTRRAPFTMIVLRPDRAPGFQDVRKIRTLGVRSGYVGAFEVRNHELPETDVIAEGREAWDSVLGTVALGKFFLGFGSIGICEHAFAEAVAHLRGRILYGKPVIAMPHLRAAVARAYACLAAMKLYAYRALDYVHAACAEDRRYLLFCAVQKARVSNEGVKTMAILSECVGAMGFEADTFFEMALRDIQLVPSLESSVHVNLAQTARFGPRYFDRFDTNLVEIPSLLAGAAAPAENPYLTEARTGAIGAIAFRPFLEAYGPLRFVPNVRRFAGQVRRFRHFLLAGSTRRTAMADPQYGQMLGQCTATIVYAQLIAENAAFLDVPAGLVSVIFHQLVADLSADALAFASLGQVTAADRLLLRRLVTIPRTDLAHWEQVSSRLDDS